MLIANRLKWNTNLVSRLSILCYVNTYNIPVQAEMGLASNTYIKFDISSYNLRFL